MSITPVTASIKPEDYSKITAAIKTIETLLPFLQNLNPQEIKSLRKIGGKTTPYVQEVLMAVKANSSVLPASVNPPDFVTKFEQEMATYSQLDNLAVALLKVLEGIKDTQVILGSQAIERADLSYSYLKQAAKNDQSIGSVVARIKEFTKRGKYKEPVNSQSN